MIHHATGALQFSTVLRLIAVNGPAHADDRFLGRWSLDPRAANSPKHRQTTRWSLPTHRSPVLGYCTIKKSYLIGEGLYLQAQCLSNGKTRVMPIGLQLKGRKLVVTWDHTKAGEMGRCRKGRIQPAQR